MARPSPNAPVAHDATTGAMHITACPKLARVSVKGSGDRGIRPESFCPACFGFGKPSEAKFLWWNPGHVRLDIEDRRCVEHVEPAHADSATFTAQHFHDRQTDRV